MYMHFNTECCAFAELIGLNDITRKFSTSEAMRAMWLEAESFKYAIFSAATAKKRGNLAVKNFNTLVKFFRRNKIGSVKTLPVERNPNTNNWIYAGVLTVDWKAFHKWCDKNLEDAKELKEEKDNWYVYL